MKFKPTPEGPVHSSEPYYDLFDGGYINPEEILESRDDIAKVCYAVQIINTFLEEAQESGHLEIT